MKRIIFTVITIILVSILAIGCDLAIFNQGGENPIQDEYEIGDTGPAGGIIFYDKGSLSDGWQYLEAAPFDMSYTSGTPGIASDGARVAVRFGYHRDSADSENLYVNGTDTFGIGNCTGTEIGAGEDNTEMLVALMGDTAYSSWDGSSQVNIYAALLCDQLVYGGHSDWFLPSSDTLEEMQRNKSVIGNFQYSSLGSYYWSSSEAYSANYGSEAIYAWYTDFYDQGADPYTVSNLRYRNWPVRSIRSF